MQSTVQVTDGASSQHNINVDQLVDGTQTQAVKIQIGNEGVSDGYASGDNPLPVALSVFFKRLFQVFARFRFSTTSDLYVNCNGSSVAVSSLPTLSTVTTVSTANIGIGDAGKAGTAILMSMDAFQNSIGRNFVRS